MFYLCVSNKDKCSADTNLAQNNAKTIIKVDFLHIVKLIKIRTIMKNFVVENEDRTLTFKFPTSLSEITPEYLAAVTDHIKVADNYTLVGLVYHETLGAIIIARKQSKKNITSGVLPIYIKSGNSENNFLNSAKVKDKLIIPTSQLNLAHHAVSPYNTISLDYFIRAIDEDITLFNRYKNYFGNEECFFVEFKLVPNCDIVGYYSSDKPTFENPYLSVEYPDGADVIG